MFIDENDKELQTKVKELLEKRKTKAKQSIRRRK